MSTTTTRRRAFRQGTLEEGSAPAPEQPAVATPKQISFIETLLEEVTLTDEQMAKTRHDLRRGISKDLASRWITRLLELKKEAPKETKRSGGAIQTDVPAGHYAVTGEDGTTDFYRVDRPEKGRWAGYVFVKLQLSDDYQNCSIPTAKAILAKIEEAGPREAAIRYGHELGKCSICNRTLTNPESIEAGIGPVCAQNRGW